MVQLTARPLQHYPPVVLYSREIQLRRARRAGKLFFRKQFTLNEPAKPVGQARDLLAQRLQGSFI
jgi:hypothetical protein